MAKKYNPFNNIEFKLIQLETDIKIIKNELKNQKKLIFFVLSLISAIFIKVLFF